MPRFCEEEVKISGRKDYHVKDLRLERYSGT